MLLQMDRSSNMGNHTPKISTRKTIQRFCSKRFPIPNKISYEIWAVLKNYGQGMMHYSTYQRGNNTSIIKVDNEALSLKHMYKRKMKKTKL